MFNKKTKTAFNSWGDDNPEKLTQSDKSSSTVKQLTDLISPAKMLDNIFGARTTETGYIPQKERRPAKKQSETLVFSYNNRSEDFKIQEKTNQILSELKKQVTFLEKSEKSLTKEIAKVKVEQLPKNSGIYYLIFFEWLISIVRGLRIKIDEGKAWLAAFNQRSKKKMGYWQKYKKHGTTFGLSHERTLATQTG